MTRFSILAAAPVLLVPVAALAQPATENTPPPPPAPAPVESSAAKLTIGGYVEEFYQLQFQDASNRITNLRGFDNRSRTFTLSNVALDVKAEKGPLTAHVILQVGHTGATYYQAETASPGTGSVNTSSGELWKYLQAANLTAKLPSEWVLEAGLFPSPIGPEVIPIKDNFNWSRSNLFFGLPFYHTGAMLSHPLGGGWTAKLHVYNGWNTIVDNNGYPSVAVSAAYTAGSTSAQLLYFGGVERPTGAPEGSAWRNLFDALAQYALTDALTIAGQLDAGVEPNDIGTSSWLAGAAYVKYAIGTDVYVALRGDYFYEKVPRSGGRIATPIFWPTKWVSEGTATLAYQPVDTVSLRLEYRHDQAASDVYFGGSVSTDPATGLFIANRHAQDTALAGVVAWF